VDDAETAFAVEQRGSYDAAGVEEEIDAGGPLHEFDGGNLSHVAKQRYGDLSAGGVAVCVEDAREAVCAFAGSHEAATLCCGMAIEGCAPLEELFDAHGALFYEHGCGVAIDEAIACGEGIFEVECYIFFAAHGDGDSALGVGGVRL
jgi:hypothetical protein